MSQPSWPPANLSHNAKDNKALQRHICLFRESSRTMTSQGRSENSDQSGPLHPMLSNADRIPLRQAEEFFTCASKDAELLAEEDNSKEFWSKHSLFVENTQEELVAICTSKKLLETYQVKLTAKATEGESSWTGSCNIYSGNLSEVPSSVAQLNKQPVRFLRAVLRFLGCCPLGTKDELVRFFALLLLSFFSSTP